MSTKTSPNKSPKNRLALIAGPTASGKSAIALDLAKARAKAKLDTWVINADSMQVYADIPIVSAAPSQDEQSVCPHHLYGAWDGQVSCSAAEWAKQARLVIAEAHKAGALPVLVGGTGMYMKVLLEGIAPIPEIDPEIREVARALDTDAAYAALMIEDPERASMLAPGDSQRIARALEVKRSTGVTLGDWQLAKTGGIGDDVDLTAAVLLPERQWLYDRCGLRFEQMLKDGAIAEVEALLKRGLSPDLPVMRAIGVPEIAAFLKDEIDRETMIAGGAQATRNYAKRQFTWLRNQSPSDWNRIESQNVDMDSIFASLLRN
ncbi:tRNA (adenosine(37)-N6)-dimethylallyltransferase MiaA [Erythrobacter sp. F6033]|uniref:tRNA (adenosine(37)-N6)-dimethylallyltransferase MiaA n=1 Tax=Erythrobacter sp. F6033 TaxID=2926401 RepID=UPI001FF2305D|nr:tRNA (adenosine(37)-N6)-dimethylallyltransferase MiaA [Erythrobacter sp. F6033]MCK0128497.1 tRNA (adenosine(37)-N6)-dimethylallyltransferase MiaA [Erythrobacter sp. F6033]